MLCGLAVLDGVLLSTASRHYKLQLIQASSAIGVGCITAGMAQYAARMGATCADCLC